MSDVLAEAMAAADAAAMAAAAATRAASEWRAPSSPQQAAPRRMMSLSGMSRTASQGGLSMSRSASMGSLGAAKSSGVHSADNLAGLPKWLSYSVRLARDVCELALEHQRSSAL